MYRPAYLAGTWYPQDASACSAAIEANASEGTAEQGLWRGLIAPHAGWQYSGRIAATTCSHLARRRAPADLVVLFGAHRGPHDPNTIFLEEGWHTPLGPLQTEQQLAARVAAHLHLSEEPALPMRPDNAAEVLLPFIKHFFPQAHLLMLGVAAAGVAADIGAALGQLCRGLGREAVFIGSTDLTHYGPRYGFTPHGRGPQAQTWVREHNDAEFIENILRGDVAGVLSHGLANQSACCPGAVAATLAAVEAFGAAAPRQLVSHSLSSDIATSENFVGYAGVLV